MVHYLIQLSKGTAQITTQERPVTQDAMEVRFLLNDKLKDKLEKVRALLGPKAIGIGYADLIEAMADLSADRLSERRFGKKRAATQAEATEQKPSVKTEPKPEIANFPTTSESSKPLLPRCAASVRYVPRSRRNDVWVRDGGCCGNLPLVSDWTQALSDELRPNCL